MVALDVGVHGYRPGCALRQAYVRSLQRAPSRGCGGTAVQPDAVARSFGELREAIAMVLGIPSHLQ
jgi:hypothetical protein